MSAVLDSREARLDPMTPVQVDAVVAVEQQVYSHPWTRGNFLDSMQAGYHCAVLTGGECTTPTLPATRGSLPPEGALSALGRPGGGGTTPTLPATRGSLPPEGALSALGRPGGGGMTPLLPAAQCAGALIGYFVAMKGVEEVHLLNITVAPAFQRQGWAQLMLEALGGWARSQQAQWLWLEVRLSNQRAQQVYARHGFRRVGVRKGYYPAGGGRREDALVMSLHLNEASSAWGGLPR